MGRRERERASVRSIRKRKSLCSSCLPLRCSIEHSSTQLCPLFFSVSLFSLLCLAPSLPFQAPTSIYSQFRSHFQPFSKPSGKHPITPSASLFPCSLRVDACEFPSVSPSFLPSLLFFLFSIHLQLSFLLFYPLILWLRLRFP